MYGCFEKGVGGDTGYGGPGNYGESVHDSGSSVVAVVVLQRSIRIEISSRHDFRLGSKRVRLQDRKWKPEALRNNVQMMVQGCSRILFMILARRDY